MERTLEQVQEEIRRTIAENKVVLYMKGTAAMPQCGFSAAVVQILKGYGRPFTAVNVLADPLVRDGVKQFSSWPTIPQLFVGGEFVGGSDIARALDASGELRAKIEKAHSG